MSAKFLLLLSKVKPIWERISNLFLDFENEVYSVEGTPSTLSSYVTHSRSGNATMVDSDGLIKWAPHNLLTYSDDLTNSWTTVSATIDDSETVSFSATTGAVTGAAATTVAGAGYTVAVELWSETDAGEQVDIGFNTNNLSNTFSSLITLTATPTLYTFSKSNNTATENSLRIRNTDGLAKTVKVRAARLYRSDLGGMVDNPDRGDSYVPTTSSAVYLPRRGHHIYNGSTSVNEGLLIESESRQNVCKQSEDITTTWTPIRTTLTANATTAPDGNTTADKLNDDGGGGTNSVFVYQTITVSAATKYTASVFLKATDLAGSTGLAFARLQASSYDGSTDGYQYFGLSGAGSLGTASGLNDSSITAYPNGWYRCTVTWTQGAADTSFNFTIFPADSISNISVDLDGTSSIFVWGAQVEEGSTPSSYIPTAGSTVTRAAETLTVPSANLPWPTPNFVGGNILSTFSTVSGDWVDNLDGTWSVVSGSTGDLSRNSLCDVGKPYLITYTITTNNNLLVYENNNTPVARGSGTYSVIRVRAPAEVGYIIFRITSAGTTATVSNVSVQEINPLAVSIQMDGTMTYADEDTNNTLTFLNWESGGEQISYRLRTDSTRTGAVQMLQRASAVLDVVETVSGSVYSPDINVPFNIASRHGSTFLNGAVDGTAMTENTTPVALPDLETTDLELAYDFMGTIRTFRIWDEDLTDEGIEYVSQ